MDYVRAQAQLAQEREAWAWTAGRQGQEWELGSFERCVSFLRHGFLTNVVLLLICRLICRLSFRVVHLLLSHDTTRVSTLRLLLLLLLLLLLVASVHRELSGRFERIQARSPTPNTYRREVSARLGVRKTLCDVILLRIAE